jgi:gamma-glutamyltranspeptidase/glutathione hydrolase/leukotriene-C4 hydrolase
VQLSKEHAGRLRRRLRADKTFPYTHYEDMVPLGNPVNDEGTTHISVIDPDGNAVSMTSTVTSHTRTHTHARTHAHARTHDTG